jgi:hypothetical protein
MGFFDWFHPHTTPPVQKPFKIVIRCQITGPVTTAPFLVIDNGQGVFSGTVVQEIATFTINERVPTPYGASIHYEDGEARIILPPDGSDWNAVDPERGLPIVLAYKPAELPLQRPTTDRHRFLIGDKEWKWKGTTDFRLLQRFLAGEDISVILEERKAAGANLVRVLPMKTNNTGWELDPRSYQAIDLAAFFEVVRLHHMYVHLTVFADTRFVMQDRDEQKRFWAMCVAQAGAVDHVFLDLLNEENHPTQRIQKTDFERPTNGVLTSHGSGLTDTHPVEPFWDFTTFHARRSPFDARCFTSYDPFEFEAEWPKRCPMIGEESVKPENYGYDVRWAEMMGRHAGIGAGGTFHWGGGVSSNQWTDQERACAEAFFRGIGQ